MDPFIRITIKDEAGRIQCLDVAKGSCLDIVEAGARKESAPDAHRRVQEMQELRVRADTLMSKFTELGEIFGLKPAIGGGNHMGFVDAVMDRIKDYFREAEESRDKLPKDCPMSPLEWGSVPILRKEIMRLHSAYALVKSRSEMSEVVINKLKANMEKVIRDA